MAGHGEHRTLNVITGPRPGDLPPHSEMAGSGPGHDAAGPGPDPNLVLLAGEAFLVIRR
jgi:hypothetical protein